MIPRLGPRLDTRKGGTEWLYECPRGCKGRKNKAPLELNIEKGVGHCFICGLSFQFKATSYVRKAVDALLRREAARPGDVSPIPFNIHPKFLERGVDPISTISRYRAGWDGSRICWPIYTGRDEEVYWRRAVYTLQQPKVMTDPGSHGLLGGHLLTLHDYIVLTEGDWKAVSIPLPFIGVAIGGSSLSSRQVDLLSIHRPREVVLAMDGGVITTKMSVLLKKGGMKVRVITLPEDKGPDDIPMKERMRLLLC